MKLSGIIYLHRITDTRMTGNSRTNIRMFKRLCGEDTLKNVVIVTNMWGKFPASAEEVREQQLRTDELFYKPILDRGGVMLRHDNTEQSAREILRHLIRNHPEALKIQKEIVDEKKDVTQTQACELLDREAREQYRQAIQRLEERMARALKIKDEETQADIQREKQEMDEKLAKVEHERSELLNTFEQEKRRFEETMRNFQSQLEGEREEALGLKRAEEKLKQEIVRLQEQLERINQESEDKIRELECRVTHQEILIEYACVPSDSYLWAQVST